MIEAEPEKKKRHTGTGKSAADRMEAKLRNSIRQHVRVQVDHKAEKIVRKILREQSKEVKVTLPKCDELDPLFFDEEVFFELAAFSGGGDNIHARYAIAYAQHDRHPTKTHLSLGLAESGIVELIREYKANPLFLPAVKEIEEYINMREKKNAQVKHTLLMTGVMEVFMRSMQHVPVMEFDKFLKETVQVKTEDGQGVYEFNGIVALKAVDMMLKLDPTILQQGGSSSARRNVKSSQMTDEEINTELARLTRAIDKRKK